MKANTVIWEKEIGGTMNENYDVDFRKQIQKSPSRSGKLIGANEKT
jgi:hypothetical protein